MILCSTPVFERISSLERSLPSYFIVQMLRHSAHLKMGDDVVENILAVNLHIMYETQIVIRQNQEMNPHDISNTTQ